MAIEYLRWKKHWGGYGEAAVDLSSVPCQSTSGWETGTNSKRITSSSRDGNIFRTLKPSENLLKTPIKPFINDIFSSRVFVAKLERSRKFNVDIGSEEKNGREVRADGVGLFMDERVKSDLKSSADHIRMQWRKTMAGIFTL